MDEYIKEFKEKGVVVIENIFTDDEISSIRDKFHKRLLDFNVNHDNVLSNTETKIRSRVKGDIAKMFYSKWKIDINTDEKIYNTMKELLLKTYGTNKGYFTHPFGEFGDIYAMIDRVCYRTPDYVKK